MATLGRTRRLRDSQCIRQVRQEGRSRSNDLLVMLQRANNLTYFRYAVIASKRVGGAVERNRCKRRLRARVLSFSDQLNKGVDYVFIAKSALLEADPAVVDAKFTQLLRAGEA